MSKTGNNLWGEHLPANCPPNCASEKDIEISYRFTLNNPPKEEDFLNHVEAGRSFPPDKECEAWAVSVFLDYDQAVKMKKRVSYLKNNAFIAFGPIPANSGVVSPPDKKSHVNWWIYKGKKVHQLFKIK